MAFTYGGNPSKSNKDMLRFYLGDTNSSLPILQDEEIVYVMNQYSNINKQLSVLFRQMATMFGIRCVKRTLGPQTEDPAVRLKYFEAQAIRYEKLSAYTGTPPAPEYASDLVFDKNMMANEA